MALAVCMPMLLQAQSATEVVAKADQVMRANHPSPT